MHRPDRTRLPEAAVEIVGSAQRVGIGHHDRVELGAFLVVRIDPREVLFDERAARQRSAAQRRLDLGSGGFFNLERTLRLRRERCETTGERESDREGLAHAA